MGEVKNGFLGNSNRTMKKLNLFGIIALSMAILSSGCHRKPSTLTPIPGMNPPPGSMEPPPATPLNNEPPVSSTTGGGLPENPGGWGPLLNGPHTEDRTTFAADTVYFDFDRAVIKPSEESKLQDIANHFKSDSTDALIIDGNCDERGTEKYNLSLGERRALAAREFLANLGVDPQRIKTVTHGASKPVDPGHNEEAWKKNRRDDMVLILPQRQ